MENIENIKAKLKESLKIIKTFEWLVDAYVLDFYVDNHWGKMPKSWTDSLKNISPENLAELLTESNQNACLKTVWPLSLLALKQLLQKLTISRVPVEVENINNDSYASNQKMLTNQNDSNNNPETSANCLTHPKLKSYLTQKSIKAKKRHEIERMSRLTARVASEHDVKYIIDFGAGLGHLARSLSYGYGLNVCCLEQQISLTQSAIEMDEQMEKLVSKHIPEADAFKKPVHLNICLSRDTCIAELVQKIKKCFNIDMNDRTFKFGIIGLHPCGDLAAILTNFFLKSKEAAFLNLVGCCYFKMTVPTPNDLIKGQDKSNSFGYPMSKYLQTSNPMPSLRYLSFESREIACHAIEVYAGRLANENYEYLRVHSFRAAIEKIICKHWPERKRSGLRSIKHVTTFRDYCRQAVNHFQDMHIPDEDIEAADTLKNLSRWKFVVIFYTLRLMLAPLVESVILYDRLLWLLENGCQAKISAIFDPVVSSRNHIITAFKT